MQFAHSLITTTEDPVAAAMDIRQSTCGVVAALTWLSWDWIICIGDETQLIWQRSNGWFRWLYVFIRYVPWLGAIATFSWLWIVQQRKTAETCNTMALVEAILVGCVIVGEEVVLLVRVHILYDRRPAILRPLLVLFAACVIATMIGMYFTAVQVGYNDLCLITTKSNAMLGVWLIPVFFETVLFAMTMWKFWQSRREGLKRPILDALVWNGTWAYAITFVNLMVTALAMTQFLQVHSAIVYFWTLCMMSFVGSHVLLDMRRLGSQATLPWWNQSIFADILPEDIELPEDVFSIEF
ncbi:hypothetical protein L226DRAFT_567147 [Lentinus tigrinus ALCF2SS1-7]|uniref:DUF6533 domain-containing protein n=1 Tax=Lentinus tigrinus ALCF2SS1-6 TaxID=1328759 RepID=A0A5C2SXE1_9APHY|nr:hypothetical protein L227DRAFT_649685 [Lentinus tigrinus ALCF2SS1-6]RPD78946.1 hypothetical protein L226DRAFT_567147 [Lentinus tigrinus ALCF2SS1-7]